MTGAIVVGLIYYLIVKNCKKQDIIIKATGIIMVIGCLAYVYIIKSGIIWEIVSKYSINMMGRQAIWGGMKGTYNFSIFFLGQGSGFTTKWLQNYSYTLGFKNLTTVIGGLHNDILRAYIEYGFIAFTAYMANFIILNANRLKRWASSKASFTYIIMVIVEIILWTTDNVANYFNYRIVFALIVFNILNWTQDDEIKKSKFINKVINLIKEKNIIKS